MSAQPNARGFLLELAAEGIAPVIGGCAGAIVAGPDGAVGGAVFGRVVEKAINFFGPRIVEKWLGWLRCRPKKEQVDAVAGLGMLSVEQARQVAGDALARLAPGASPVDKALALEYVAAIPEAVQQSLVLDLKTGGMTVPPSLSIESSQSLMQLLPTDVPPYAAPTHLPGTQYFLKRVIGTGGFGIVYEAEMPALQDLPLAIKFCLDPSMVDMLKRERDNLKALRTSGKENWSTNIVRLYGYELDHATPFLVYEYVHGGTLTTYLARRREEIGRKLSPAEVLGLIVQITEALAFAHARGLVHRDLKPANVLVDGTTLKLADFGIGGIVAGYAVAHSQIGRSLINQLHADEQVSVLRGSGTPLYMDPDQRRGGDANPKHDLYSLGVVWYQLLIGDVTRELHAGWDEELASEFKVPKDHIEIMKQCVGWIKNRPNNAVELLKLLQFPVPSIRIASLQPQRLSVGAGSSAVVVVRVARQNFDGPLTVSVEELPTTMTAPTSSIQAGGTESQIHLTADKNATPETTNSRIVVRGNGVRDTETLTVQVTPPPPPDPDPIQKLKDNGIPELVKAMKQKLAALRIELSDDLGPVIPKNGELGFSIIMSDMKFCVSIRANRLAKLLVTRSSDTSLRKLRISLDGPKDGKVPYWVINEKKGRFEIDSLVETLAAYKQLLDNREGT